MLLPIGQMSLSVSLLLENHPGQFCSPHFLWGAGADYLGTRAHWQKQTTCASAFTMCQQLSHIHLCEKKHPRHTNWLMSRSISCCMKLKMASGRRSIVYLLRGHASAFLCQSKKKIYCNAASSSVK